MLIVTNYKRKKQFWLQIQYKLENSLEKSNIKFDVTEHKDSENMKIEQ